MNPRPFLTTLRVTGFALALATVATWGATGAHWGWTQTSLVELHEDEVTGITYPVRRPQFTAGVELLAAGITSGLALAGLTFLPFRRRSVQRAASVTA